MQEDTQHFAENFFHAIGLGEGASVRAKQLALLGRMAELDAEIGAVESARRPKRGAPKKPFSRDVVRASRILGMAEMAYRLGGKVPSTRALIDLATHAENILASTGHLSSLDFRNADFTSIEKSVGRGLKALEVDMTNYRNNPAEFFVRCANGQG